MDFLGEQFNPVDCKAMCDNCKKGVQVVDRCMKKETIKIVRMIQHISDLNKKITMNQAIDTLKGRKCTSKLFNDSDVGNFKGSLKTMEDSTLRRIILQLLLIGVLEENFVTNKRINTITVYLIEG